MKKLLLAAAAALCLAETSAAAPPAYYVDETKLPFAAMPTTLRKAPKTRMS